MSDELTAIVDHVETWLLCGDLWTPTRLAADLDIHCDRKPRHTGKHMNRTRKLEWWKGPSDDVHG